MKGAAIRQADLDLGEFGFAEQLDLGVPAQIAQREVTGVSGLSVSKEWQDRQDSNLQPIGYEMV